MPRRALIAIAIAILAPAPGAAAAVGPRAAPPKAVRAAEGAGSVRVPVVLSRPAGRDARISFRTVAGTARGNDFASRRGTLRWRRGRRVATIVIRLSRDRVDEPDERFTVRLSRPRGVRLGGRRATTVTIVDDDAPSAVGAPVPAVAVSADADRAVAEPAAPGALTAHGLVVELSAAASRPVSVQYDLVAAGVTTTADDADLGSGTLTFAPGETATAVPGSIRGDALDEADEHVRLLLTGAAGAQIADPEALLTILDDPADVPPTVSVAGLSVAEVAGGATADVQVSLSAPSGRAVTVAYATRDASAVSAGPAPDFAAATGTLGFQPGETTKQVPIAIRDDPRDEPAQSFALTLTAPDGATLGDAQASVTIADDDPPPSLTIDDVSRLESSSVAQFTVRLSQISEQPVGFEASTVPSTATGAAACGAGADYVRLAGLDVPIAAGEPTVTVGVGLCEDTIDEGAETASVVLSAPSHATIGDGTGLLTILDDD